LKKPKRTRLREGDWFAVPIDQEGFVLGLAARYKMGHILGYFFGPVRREPPNMLDSVGLRPDRAFAVRRFVDYPLVHGEWPILGHQDGWDRSMWPVPQFAFVDPIKGSRQLRTYDDDAITWLTTEPYTGDISGLPYDGLDGEIALVHTLRRALAQFGKRIDTD
jgi:hypothetical protein